MCYGVILEAIDLLAQKGIFAQYHQLRTLWPMLDDTPAFTKRCPNIFVVEYNATAQLAKLIIAHGGEEENINNILRYDGIPMQAQDLVNSVISKLNLKEDEVA
jgi:pyruvate/2-oxoacid:ferredoxin oxidoreductase alpha subunit